MCRRGIKKALLITEKKEEKEEEVDLLFAEDEEEDTFLKEEGREKFTPMCTPTRIQTGTRKIMMIIQT